MVVLDVVAHADEGWRSIEVWFFRPLAERQPDEWTCRLLAYTFLEDDDGGR